MKQSDEPESNMNILSAMMAYFLARVLIKMSFFQVANSKMLRRIMNKKE